MMEHLAGRTGKSGSVHEDEILHLKQLVPHQILADTFDIDPPLCPGIYYSISVCQMSVKIIYASVVESFYVHTNIFMLRHLLEIEDISFFFAEFRCKIPKCAKHAKVNQVKTVDLSGVTLWC